MERQWTRAGTEAQHETASTGPVVFRIADARSDGALLRTLRAFHYPRQIGPGVYDVHSPNVPTVDFIVGKLWATLGILPAEQVWINPDCGLKTRGYAELVPALRNMVEAARQVRSALERGAGSGVAKSRQTT